MNVLALESATEACSAALFLDGAVTVRFAVEPRRHSALLLPMIESLLAEAEVGLERLDGIGFGAGPGSFTGVRIATGVAHGLALATGLPLAPVSTLAALALQALDEHRADQVYAGLDARMSEVYWGVYQRDGAGVRLVAAERVGPARAVATGHDTPAVGIGSAWDVHGDTLRARLGATTPHLAGRMPNAAHIARLAALTFGEGGGMTPEQAQPVYLRDEVAQPPARDTASSPFPC